MDRRGTLPSPFEKARCNYCFKKTTDKTEIIRHCIRKHPNKEIKLLTAAVGESKYKTRRYHMKGSEVPCEADQVELNDALELVFPSAAQETADSSSEEEFMYDEPTINYREDNYGPRRASIPVVETGALPVISGSPSGRPTILELPEDPAPRPKSPSPLLQLKVFLEDRFNISEEDLKASDDETSSQEELANIMESVNETQERPPKTYAHKYPSVPSSGYSTMTKSTKDEGGLSVPTTLERPKTPIEKFKAFFSNDDAPIATAESEDSLDDVLDTDDDILDTDDDAIDGKFAEPVLNSLPVPIGAELDRPKTPIEKLRSLFNRDEEEQDEMKPKEPEIPKIVIQNSSPEPEEEKKEEKPISPKSPTRSFKSFFSRSSENVNKDGEKEQVEEPEEPEPEVEPEIESQPELESMNDLVSKETQGAERPKSFFKSLFNRSPKSEDKDEIVLPAITINDVDGQAIKVDDRRYSEFTISGDHKREVEKLGELAEEIVGEVDEELIAEPRRKSVSGPGAFKKLFLCCMSV